MWYPKISKCFENIHLKNKTFYDNKLKIENQAWKILGGVVVYQSPSR